MTSWIVIVVILLVLLVLVAGVVVLARSQATPVPPLVAETPREDPALRRARQEALDRQGTDLLERRVELDARRGTLGGDSDVYDAFEQLEARFQRREMSEQEFEEAKVRLLGGTS